jgi:hypothetical protein
MASTYSNLKIQLMATGENSGTWGNVTNDNLGIAGGIRRGYRWFC